MRHSARKPRWYQIALALTVWGLVVQQVVPLLHELHEHLEAQQAIAQYGDQAPAHPHDESRCDICQDLLHAKLLIGTTVIYIAVAPADPIRAVTLDSIPRPAPQVICAASPRGPPVVI